jgi:fibronectin-binding autotransporter adhesin
MKKIIILSPLFIVASSILTVGYGEPISTSQSVSFETLSGYSDVVFQPLNSTFIDTSATLTINNLSSTNENDYAGAITQSPNDYDIICVGSLNITGTDNTQVIQLSGLASSPPITGTVTVNNATLQGATSSGASLSLSDSANYNLEGSQTVTSLAGISGTTVNLGTETLTISNGSSSDEFLGNVVGTGNIAVEKGTLTLTNGENNPFKGTVQLVNQNSSLTFNQPIGKIQTFPGNITGAGALNLEGGGSVILSGTNTFTGGTTIQGSSTFQGSTESLPTQSGITLDSTASTVNFFQNQSPYIGTYAQAISGLGGVFIEQGSITFTGPNSYTGGTTIMNPQNGSQLIASIGNDNTSGTLSPTGNIQLQGTSMIFNQSLSGQPLNGEYSGVISGSGTVFIGVQGVQKIQETQEAKGGSITFTGANAYEGTTVIYPSNTLIVSAGNSTSAATLPNGSVDNEGTLIFSQNASSDPYSFSGAISSTGQVIIESTKSTPGAFTLSLGGANSYTGNTIVATKGAILQGAFPKSTVVLVADGSTYSLNGTDQTIGGLAGDNTAALVYLGANTLTVGNNNSTTFSGTIQDGPGGVGGNLTKVGSGTLTLATPPSYTGSTTIEGGTLIGQIPTTSPSPLIINGGTFQMAASQNFQTIAGSGGTLNLESFNLGIIGDSSSGLAANIIGAGSISIGPSGPATFTFTGNNSYTGGTSVSTGSTLTGTTNSLIGTISNSNLVVFNQPSPGTFSGMINGSGTVKTEGAGVVAFPPGSINCSGGLINDSDIKVSASSIAGNIVNNGSVTFDQTSAGTYAGSISGTGSLIKEGIAQLTLKGVSPLTGQTTVKEGALSVQGGLPKSHVVVEKLGALKGIGKVGSADIKGKIMPGNSIGAIQILNDFAMEPGSIYEAEVSVNGADTINVGKKAQLAGILDLRLFETTRPQLKNKSFTLLTAGTRRQGAFTHTSTDRIKYTVQYLPQSVQVFIGNLQDFTDAFPPGNTSNAEKTAAYFDTFADNTDLSPDLRHVINGLDNFLQAGNSAAVQNAFNQIQPSQYKELGQLSFLNNEVVNRTVGSQQQNLRESLWVEKELEAYAGSGAISPQRVASFHHLAKSAKGFKSSSILQARSQPHHRLGMLALPGSERVGMPANNWIKLGRSSVWVQSYGQIERTTGNHGNAGIRSETGGISLGGDHEVMKNTYLGFLGGMSTTPFHWQQGRGSGRVKSYYGGIYGTWLSQTGFYADGQLIAGGNNYNSHRNIVYPGVNRKARQNHNGGQFSTDLQAGYVWSLKHLTVQPYADATYMFVNESGFREKGAQSLDFKIKGRMSQFFRGEIGAQVYKTYVLCDALVRPALQLSWVHKRSMGPNSAKVQGGLVSQAPSLVVSGDNRTRNQVAPGLALTVQFAKGLYVIGNVSSQFGGGQKLGDALIRVGYDF